MLSDKEDLLSRLFHSLRKLAQKLPFNNGALQFEKWRELRWQGRQLTTTSSLLARVEYAIFKHGYLIGVDSDLREVKDSMP